MLKSAGLSVTINPLGRKFVEKELKQLISNYDILIAGTEPITDKVLDSASNLKLISRVGIGLDSVDLNSTRNRKISVCYTPDAPSPAVADLTIGLMLSLIRHVHLSNATMREGDWRRYYGQRLCDCIVGVIGAGRIGKSVVNHLLHFSCKKILVNDIDQDIQRSINGSTIEWCDKEHIFRNADVISLHLPLTHETRDLIDRAQICKMKPSAFLINTSRGGIINEVDLYETMRSGHLAGAAIDVFEEEPYRGPLVTIKRCILTAHMGSMSQDCRARMEIEATEEAVRYARGQPLKSLVPEEEYEIQKMSGFGVS
jgi:D-3-phosphoglycerate dehydrogenase